MTIKDFLNITPEEMVRMDMQQRRSLVDEMSKKANRRLDKLDELFFVAPAMSSRLDEEGNIKYFSSDYKNFNQLGNELKNLQKFLSNKTSTTAGARNSARRIYAKVMNSTMKETSINDVASAFESSPDKMNIFWSAYNKVLEANPGIITTKDNNIAGQFTSGQVQQMVYEVYLKNKEATSDDIWYQAQQVLMDEYEPPKNPGENPFTFTRHG